MSFRRPRGGRQGGRAVRAAQSYQPWPRTRSEVLLYKAEPYVASPLTSTAPHHMSDAAAGRGSTGSAGWMQRAGLESILGLHFEGGVLRLDPCIPKTWPRFELIVRFHSAHYEILVENPDGVSRGVVAAMVDGAAIGQRPLAFKMHDDGVTHHVLIRLG